MKRTAIPVALRAEVMERYNNRCAVCDIDVVRLDIAMREMPSSWTRMHSGPMRENDAARYASHFGKRDRFTSPMTHGALLGRHKDRAHALLGRLWGIALTPGCHFHEIDHIIPVAEGGRNVASNLRLLCRRCHKGVSVALVNRLRKRPKKGVGRGFR